VIIASLTESFSY